MMGCALGVVRSNRGTKVLERNENLSIDVCGEAVLLFCPWEGGGKNERTAGVGIQHSERGQKQCGALCTRKGGQPPGGDQHEGGWPARGASAQARG